MSAPNPAKTTPQDNVKKPISPDTKLEIPDKTSQPDELPRKSSGQSSGSKNGIAARPDPQPEEQNDEKTRLNQEKNRHLTELCQLHFNGVMKSFNHQLLKLYLKHDHMSREQFRKEHPL